MSQFSGEFTIFSNNRIYDDDNLDWFDSSTTAPFQGEVVDLMSDSQVKILSIFYVISGTLSVMGSSTIASKVLKNRYKATSYDRLLLGLSLCDIVASLSWILTPFLAPSETSPRVWAFGNDATCTLLGTLSQFGFSAIMYNCFLSFYYLLTVRFGVKREVFAAKYEPCFHIFILLYFACTSVAGAAIGVYSEVDVGLGCWVNNYPEGCSYDPTAENYCTSTMIGWIFAAGLTLITFFVLIINNIIIYRYVKRILSREIISISSGSSRSLSSDAAVSPNKAPTTTKRVAFNLQQTQQQQKAEIGKTKQPQSQTSGLTPAISMPTPGKALTLAQLTVRLERSNQHKRFIKEVATQGFLYVTAFLITYTPAIALRAIEAYGTYPLSEEPIFPLLLLNSILLPLQGFFNMFVYNFPNWTRVRAAYPDRSLFWTMQKACLDSNIPTIRGSSRVCQSVSSVASARARGIAASAAAAARLEAINRMRLSGSSSGGRAFSSDLDVLHEGSEDVDDDDNDDNNNREVESSEESNDFENDSVESCVNPYSVDDDLCMMERDFMGSSTSVDLGEDGETEADDEKRGGGEVLHEHIARNAEMKDTASSAHNNSFSHSNNDDDHSHDGNCSDRTNGIVNEMEKSLPVQDQTSAWDCTNSTENDCKISQEGLMDSDNTESTESDYDEEKGYAAVDKPPSIQTFETEDVSTTVSNCDNDDETTSNDDNNSADDLEQEHPDESSVSNKQHDTISNADQFAHSPCSPTGSPILWSSPNSSSDSREMSKRASVCRVDFDGEVSMVHEPL